MVHLRAEHNARRFSRAPRRSTSLFALTALVCLWAGCEKPRPAPPERRTEYVQEKLVGRASVAAGAVQIRRGQAAWDELVLGEEIRSGDALRATGPAAARVDFEGGGGLRLAEPAEVAVFLSDAAPAVPVIALEQGLVRGYLGAPATGQPEPAMRIAAPPFRPATLTAKGGKPVQFRAQRIKDGLEVAILQGEATLAAAGDDKPLRAGEVARVVSGELGAMEAMIDPPALISPEPDERFFCPGLIVRLAWKEVGGATGYAVQVSTEPTFQQPLLSAEPKAAHALFVPRTPGRLLWRVAARDAQMRMGAFGEPRTLFCEAAPPEDRLVAPVAGYALNYHGTAPPNLTFRWKASLGAHSYELVIARGGDLRAPSAIVQETAESSFDLEGLEDGTYTWGVYTKDSQNWPLFLSPRPFTVAKATVKTTLTIKTWGN